MNRILSRRTPYNDQYESCAETRATLLIYPGRLHPLEVTDYLQIQPTHVQAAGEEVTNPSGRKRIAKTSHWTLSSDGKVRSLDVRRHLDWLLELLAPKKEGLARLQEINGALMSVNCVWHSRAGNGGPTLWPEQMKQMADLNLECSFDVYFFSDD